MPVPIPVLMAAAMLRAVAPGHARMHFGHARAGLGILRCLRSGRTCSLPSTVLRPFMSHSCDTAGNQCYRGNRSN